MRRLLFVLSILALAGCGSSGSPVVTPTTAPTATPGPKAAVIVPLYAYPGAEWDHVLRAKAQHVRVSFTIIANPASGPGVVPDPNYVAYIAKARSAGIAVAGYVATGYGTRASADVQRDIDRYVDWYHVDGIFLDEMTDSDVGYYQRLSDYAHGLALKPVILNPGVPVISAANADAVVAYESPGYPSTAALAALSPPARRWGYIAGAVPFERATIRATLPYVGFVYATDGAEPQCYCRLPSYFDALVALLDQ